MVTFPTGHEDKRIGRISARHRKAIQTLHNLAVTCPHRHVVTTVERDSTKNRMPKRMRPESTKVLGLPDNGLSIMTGKPVIANLRERHAQIAASNKIIVSS
jgi:hypothetical protein